MPTPVSHFAVGYAIGAWGQAKPPVRRVCLIAAASALLPDIGTLGSAFANSQAPLLGHRTFTHSLAFAFVAAAIVTLVFFRHPRWAQQRLRIGLIVTVALLSHSCLDALSTYSKGVEFFAPFSGQRFRFLWTPLGNPDWRLRTQLVQEVLVVLLPAILLAWLGVRRGRREVPAGPARADMQMQPGSPQPSGDREGE
jgi:inner membrane protein